MIEWPAWQRSLMTLGVSKTGVTGIGVFSMVIFSDQLPAQQSTVVVGVLGHDRGGAVPARHFDGD